MYIDAITLAAVADEWRILLTGARIDTIIQPTEHAIALQCYAPGTQGQGGHNYWLYLSAHPQLARAHLTTRKPAKIASEPPSFVMLLRKYLEGARIESIQQPRWERVLEIIAGHRAAPDSDERIHYRLIVEIMGRLSNIIFCNEHGLILGSLKRVGAEVNRYRVIAANVQYIPPPPQQHTVAGQSLPRLEPTTVTVAQLVTSAFHGEDATPLTAPSNKKARQRSPEQPKLWQLLTKHLLGFSPLLAREAVYRATGDTETLLQKALQDEVAWENLARNVRELAALYDTHAWQPQLVELAGVGKGDGQESASGEALASPRPLGAINRAPTTSLRSSSLTASESSTPLPVAFAPYALEQYANVAGAQVRHSPSINVLIDEYYAGAEWRDAMEGVRAPLRKVLQTQRERCIRKAEVLQRALATSEEAAQLRLQAELLLAYQHDVQRGQSSVTLHNFFAEEGEAGESPSEVTIPLDPRFDAVGNANRLFNKYHKLRRATALIPAQIEQNALELATIEQLLADLMLADTPAEVALVKAEVQAAGLVRGARPVQTNQKKAQKPHKGKGGKPTKGKPVPPGGGVPLRVQSHDGFTLLIGKNSRQNEEVTFHQATANDIWLHARGVPGAHVIIKAAGREIPRSTIEQAASLAAYYSQARGSTNVPVDYTLQRYVRHMKGGGPGMVIYERERTIYAAPTFNL
jgi:predicted ribosome quality control (RQC) complex YloA/Tae2 family protein